MSVPQLASIMIDTTDPARLASFWSELLGVSVRNQHGEFIWLAPQRPGGNGLAFQRVADPTPGKNRVHLDLGHPDLDELAERVVALGGSVVDEYVVPGFTWRVYADPDGNVFCAGHDL